MKGAGYIAVAAAWCLLGTACSVTRNIPEGSYLLRKVRIEDDRTVPRKERITSSELARYVRQKPNRRFLGTNFYVWMYEQADTAKHNWWNNFKRRIGQEPVLLDMELTEKSAENLKIYMDSRGFYSSRATFEVDTVSHRKKATVTYRTVQGEPYRIDRITYDFRDRFLRQIVLPDTVHTLLHVGDIFDIGTLDNERKRITSYLRDRGYYNFSVNNIEYVADTLGGDRRVGVKVVVKQYLTGYNEQGEAVMDNNTVYRIDRINIFPDYDPITARLDKEYASRLDTVYYRGLNVIYEGRPNVRPRVLRSVVPLYPNYVFDAGQVNRTYSNMMSLGYFRSAKVSFTEAPRPVDMTDYVTYVGADGRDSTQTEYTREGYLHCDILCTPALKQSYRIELEGSTTSSFYGLSATVGYQNRNIFRGAELFDIAFTVGYEYMKTPHADKRNAKEFGVTAGLTFPRFLLPVRTRTFRSVVQPRTRLELSINFQDRPFYRRTLSSASWGYTWNDNRYSTYTVRPIDINVIDMGYIDQAFFDNLENQYLRQSYTTKFIGGLSVSYVFNNQRKHLGGNATVIRFNAETAGNLIDGLEHLFSEPVAGKNYYHIFGIRYAQYFRFDLSLSRKIMLGEKTALAGRLYGGLGLAYGNDQTVPFDRLFYAGGSNSMRGWTPRTLGPGSVPEPEQSSAYPAQLGDMKLEANLEFRFPIWGIFHGATFADVGNIWYVRQSSDATTVQPAAVFHIDNFYKQLGFDVGLGIRLDIKFAVLRLDWGIQIHNPNKPAGERWIHNFRWKNTALNFGVGYPF
ncbi:BamA/TamA family outer membrane protein [uncultured Alistipes sp.]|uniref:translocation and assembly module lipoprotein TamL n=1 Tax=Alistipes sp. TaxID=1872444 RepID=UPI00266DA5E0|nr:BamA/TamA family outer membrane protein [uncultured Alistipes sp.]